MADKQPALSVFSKHKFKSLRPGENDDTFDFTGPGVVVIACETNAVTREFQTVTEFNAPVDALADARRLLSGHRSLCSGYLYARLASVTDGEERRAAVEALSRGPHYSAGK
jgi:hypothetical protein